MIIDNNNMYLQKLNSKMLHVQITRMLHIF